MPWGSLRGPRTEAPALLGAHRPSWGPTELSLGGRGWCQGSSPARAGSCSREVCWGLDFQVC